MRRPLVLLDYLLLLVVVVPCCCGLATIGVSLSRVLASVAEVLR